MKTLIVGLLALTSFSSFAQSEENELKCLNIGLNTKQVCTIEKSQEELAYTNFKLALALEGSPSSYENYSNKLKELTLNHANRRHLTAVCVESFMQSCVLELEKELR